MQSNQETMLMLRFMLTGAVYALVYILTDDVGGGREWLICSCTRQIHEDCIDNDKVEIDNCVFCPLCYSFHLKSFMLKVLLRIH